MCGLAGLAFAMLRIRFTACNLGSGDLEGCFPSRKSFPAGSQRASTIRDAGRELEETVLGDSG